MTSYATIAEADAYFGDRLNVSVWEDASTEEKRRGLAQATGIIDRLNIAGEKTVSTQENQFPRADDTDVPNDVKYACSEIAMALLDGVDPQIEYENLRLKSQAYGSVRASFETDVVFPHQVAGIPSMTAWRYLAPYLRDGNELDLYRVS